MPKGGARPGAGRKPGPPTIKKGIPLSPAAWAKLEEIAKRTERPQARILESLIEKEFSTMSVSTK